jgi:hypothetical protein
MNRNFASITAFCFCIVFASCDPKGVGYDNKTSDEENSNLENDWCYNDNDCQFSQRCEDGVCVPCPEVQCKSDLKCDDDNPCTDDFCDSDHTCQHDFWAINTPCDDNNPITENDVCRFSAKFVRICQGSISEEDVDEAEIEEAENAVEDIQEEVQDNGIEEVNVLDEQVDDFEITDETVEAVDVVGEDKNTPVACTIDEECNDGLDCTNDSCSPEGACQFANRVGSCDDGNPLTINDKCKLGICKGIPVKCVSADYCNDNDYCTVDACTASYICVNSPKPGCCNDDGDCNDGIVNTFDYCDNHICQQDTICTPENCNDNDVCTNDVCAGSACVNDPIPNCEDNPEVQDYFLVQGDTLELGNNMNLRIELIQNDKAFYSIWGLDQSGACRLMSSTGIFTFSGETENFREFTGSFIELIQISSNEVHLKKFTGFPARQRCEEIADWKAPLVCHFYPTEGQYYVENEYFRIYYYEGYEENSTLLIQGLKICYEKMLEKLPALAQITPFGSHWRLYYANSSGGASADYDRISIGKAIFETADWNGLQALIKTGQCDFSSYPMQVLSHELMHVLFSATFLQGVYDNSTKTEILYKPGSNRLDEGLANFFPFYMVGEFENQYSKCTETSVDHLAYPNYDPQSLIYSKIFDGTSDFPNGYYYAGYCFYERLYDDCGEEAFLALLTQQIELSGSIEEYPSVFKMLGQICGYETVEAILIDFGFDTSMMQMNQQNPSNWYYQLDMPGCIE